VREKGRRGEKVKRMKEGDEDEFKILAVAWSLSRTVILSPLLPFSPSVLTYATY
jgi:hypothetical protein